MNKAEVLKRYDEKHSNRSDIRDIKADTQLTLASVLISGGIDWRVWAEIPGAKSFKHLLKEIKDGETKMGFNIRTGELIRQVSKAVIDVIYTRSDGVDLRVYEEFFENGQWHSREPSEKVKKRGVQEKKFHNETFRSAALRGLEEEMRVTYLTSEEAHNLVHLFNSQEEKVSKGFPGLKSIYYYGDFTFSLPDRFYKPEYIVPETGFNTRLVWGPAINL